MPPKSARFTLRQLELFSAAAQSGSFAAAAEQEFVTPTAVSLAVTELERILDAQLLRRRRAQGVSLTPAGVHLLARSEVLLHEASEIHRSIASDGSGELTGPVTLGCYPTLSATVVPALIQRFRAQHPGVDLTIVDGTMDDLLTMLDKGELDIAIGYRISMPPGIEESLLYELEPYVLLNAGHRLADAAAVSFRDLADEPLILLDLPPSGQHTLDLIQREGVFPRVAHRTPNFELARSMVARGLGYSVLIQTPSITTSYEGLPLVTKKLTPAPWRESVVVLWRSGVRLTDRARALMDCAHEIAREEHN